MNCKSDINIIQKRLLDRLNVKIGSTMFTIIEAITRQAYAKDSFVVSQKNSTLAKKCKVTASTISRNLRKLKDKCADLITIEQNRNVEEKFASLVFTFIIEKGQTEMSNGGQTEPLNDTNVCHNEAEITSSLFSTNSLAYISNPNKDLIHNIVKQEDVSQDKIIYDTYLKFSKQGITKSLFNKVLSQVQKNKGIRSFGKYLTGALKKVVGYKEANNNMEFVDEAKIKVDINKIPYYYDWIDG
ncbi:hypothetical protein P4646_20005 [Peribacillus simplex]|uniref:hypothetical protein n=1 Tax=Peribacillus simplex TaxID=1478 RepID=UPI002E1C2951|nr:hypothetical protein [Peribacillus simplex]MED4096810.1 hypothetical protein [Peribacillus simplex]